MNKKPKIRRSPKWEKTKNDHLRIEPHCALCGEHRKKYLRVHHVVPVHVDPSKELDQSNLITLCQGEVINCHLLFGHLRDWDSWNASVREDVEIWKNKIKIRPYLNSENSE